VKQPENKGVQPMKGMAELRNEVAQEKEKQQQEQEQHQDRSREQGRE
jgi:hypothetical protein